MRLLLQRSKLSKYAIYIDNAYLDNQSYTAASKWSICVVIDTSPAAYLNPTPDRLPDPAHKKNRKGSEPKNHISLIRVF